MLRELRDLTPAGLRRRIHGLDLGMTRRLQITDNTTLWPLGVDSAEKHPKGLGVCTEPGCLGLNASSATQQPCDLVGVTLPLLASVSSSVKWRRPGFTCKQNEALRAGSGLGRLLTHVNGRADLARSKRK